MFDYVDPSKGLNQTVNSSSYVQSKQMYDSDVQSGNGEHDEHDDDGAKIFINEPGRPSNLSHRAPPVD